MLGGIEADAKKTLTGVGRAQSAASQFILCHPTPGGTAGQRVGRVDKGRECQGHHWGAPPTFQMMPAMLEKMPAYFPAEAFLSPRPWLKP